MTDDIERIRERDRAWGDEVRRCGDILTRQRFLPPSNASQACHDRDTLLARIDALEAEPQHVRNASRCVVLTDYHHGSHCPYTGILHDPNTDERVDDGELLEALCEAVGAVDGDEIEVIVRGTGRRPFDEEKVRLVEPHIYRRAPESEEL